MNESFVIVIDTREQQPFPFAPDVVTRPGTLATGDYAVWGLDGLAVERKSLDDLISCMTNKREHTMREVPADVPDDFVGNAALPPKAPASRVKEAKNRDRFERELGRLNTLRVRGYVIVEATHDDILEWRYHSQLNPISALGIWSRWIVAYERVHFELAGSHAAQRCYDLLRMHYRDAVKAAALLRKNERELAKERAE